VSVVTDLTPERQGATPPAKKARTEGERFALLLELTNLALVAIAFVAVHLAAGAGPLLWGTLVGGLIGAANLRSMIFLGKRILMGTPQGKAKYMILLALKLGILCAVVWLALANLPIDSIGFLIGFSTLLPAALVATALKSLERPPTQERRP